MTIIVDDTNIDIHCEITRNSCMKLIWDAKCMHVGKYGIQNDVCRKIWELMWSLYFNVSDKDLTAGNMHFHFDFCSADKIQVRLTFCCFSCSQARFMTSNPITIQQYKFDSDSFNLLQNSSSPPNSISLS